MKNILLVALALVLATSVMAGLTKEDLSWLNSNHIKAPEGMSAKQEQGLHEIITRGCSAREHVDFGGIGMTCNGDKVADVDTYLDLVAATNLWNAVRK